MRIGPAVIVMSLAGHAAEAQILGAIEDVVVGSSSNPRALQGLAAATLPGLGDLFLTSTGSCVPLIGTGNGLARFDGAWSIVTERDYSAEPCHFGDITVGADGTIYAPASEYDGIGFTNDRPFQINRFDAATLAPGGAWNADDLQTAYGFEDLAGADYRHGDLYIVDYRDASPDPTRIYVFDLATDPPAMIDVIQVASRRVNGVESYGDRLYLAADVNSSTAKIDVYDFDLLTGAVNQPVESYTFDITDNGATPLGQHSEGLTFRTTAAGPELWVSAALGTIARRIELPAPPQVVTWTGAGSEVAEAFSKWSDYSFGWDGQPTGDIDAVIDLLDPAEVTVDADASCGGLTLLGAGDASLRRLVIASSGSLTTAGAMVAGAEAMLDGGAWTSTSPIDVGADAAIRGRGLVAAPVLVAGAIEPAGPAPLLQFDELTLAATAQLRIDIEAGAGVHVAGAAAIGGAVEIVAQATLDACARTTILSAPGGVTGAFAAETLPEPAPGLRARIVSTSTTVDFVVTRAADFDADLRVDGADLGLLLGGWGQPGEADLNGDGVTDGADLGLLLGQWGDCAA